MTVVHNLSLGGQLLQKVFRCNGLGDNCHLLDVGPEGSDLLGVKMQRMPKSTGLRG